MHVRMSFEPPANCTSSAKPRHRFIRFAFDSSAIR